MTGPSYPCPCCGYLVFAESPGSFDICPFCYWEDDALQLEFATTLAGGANGVTLAEAQRTYGSLAAGEGRLPPHLRAPSSTDLRDPDWRPVDPALDSFEDWQADDRLRAPDDPEALYYWRPTFWRRPRVT
jgi:hypothetical protein